MKKGFVVLFSLFFVVGSLFAQAPNNAQYIENQYDILKGKIATAEDEVMVVINKDSQLTDITLGQLGFFTQVEFLNIVYGATNDTNYDENNHIAREERKRTADFCKHFVNFLSTAIYFRV